MSNDDRLARYLSDQANAITLPPADPAEAARRGRRRRTRRRGALIASVSVLAVAATSLAFIDPDGGSTVDNGGFAAPDVVPSAFDWTVVAPHDGLGYNRSTAQLTDGSIYSLSTAPGTGQDDASFTPHLYRSGDGTEWTEAALPEGVATSALGSAGSTLYALGTAPAAGGGRDLVLSASQDGAATWSDLELPDDVTTLDRQFREEIQIRIASVAALDSDHVAAAVTVQANPDLAALVAAVDPELTGDEFSYQRSDGGVEVVRYETCEDSLADAGECTVDPAMGVTTTVTSPVSGDEARELEAQELEADRQATWSGDSHSEVVASFTWDELDLDPQLRDLVDGETHVYATQDGASFQRASVVEGHGEAAQLIAGPGGFRLFVSAWPEAGGTTTVLGSTDGAAWAPVEGSPLAGSLQTAGLLGDRPAVALWTGEESSTVQVQQADGSWSGFDLAGAGQAGTYVGEVAFGPLGLAAVVWSDGAEDAAVMHSQDGTTVSTVPMADLVGARNPNVVGVTVTADAIFVRVGDAPDGDDSTPPTQKVVVGTPA